ncbi:hypothetical protein B0H63DRAFT_564374 [Podospora didyma]|uniref:Uncharacterized protein n=1 Tax=Podospora didyma TaxID=330526 RepID=A0AAE0K5Q0_9PEZI|nr:hypothetical protein B0H63DRAFT_564374 [Podospora didyma]
MFDINWADEAAEVVGDRNARKQNRREQSTREQNTIEQTRVDESSTTREPASTRSSSSTGNRVAGFFASLKKSGSSKSVRTPPAAVQPTTDDDGNSLRNSLNSPPNRDSVVPSYQNVSSAASRVIPDDGTETATYRSSKESMMSKQTNLTIPTIPSRGSAAASGHSTTKITQQLERLNIAKNQQEQHGPRSRVDKPAGTRYEPRTTYDARLLEAKNAQAPITNPIAVVSSIPIFMSPPGSSGSLGGGGVDTALPFQTQQSSDSLASTPSRPPRQRQRINNSAAPSPLLNSFGAAQDPKAWKRVNAWSSSSSLDKASSLVAPPKDNGRAETDANNSISLDLAGVQKEIKRMGIARPETIIVRLEERGNVNDASFYKDLETEKTRWLLWALDNIYKTPLRKQPLLDGKEAVALFESQGMFSAVTYLAALHPTAMITHLAPNPLSHYGFPNVRPLVSAVQTTLRLPSNSYAAVYGTVLPSSVPGKNLPQLLQNIQRCLIPGGVFHMVLIDVWPVTDGLGPVMTQWLAENLMPNLKAQSRCHNPTKYIMKWLEEVQLSTPDSVKTTAKFRALPFEVPENETPTAKKERLKFELETTVGRKLWQQTWGPFVEGNKWWWQDEKVVEECQNLGTYFKYWILDAKKPPAPEED